MKQYVDMKNKQSENRMLKAIAESEGRLTQLIMKAFSAPKQAASNMPSDVCGHVGSSKNVVGSSGEEISGQKKGSDKEILAMDTVLCTWTMFWIPFCRKSMLLLWNYQSLLCVDLG